MHDLAQSDFRIRPISHNGSVLFLVERRVPSNFLPVLPLVQFAKRVMDAPLNAMLTPSDGIHTYGCINGIVIHRERNFQAELFIVNGNTELPPHGHPDIDSVEVYINGDIDFTLEGQRVLPEVCDKRGHMVRVLPNQEHGAKIGPSGGCFISVQRWLNGVLPTSVGLNWSGDPHEELNKQGYK